MFVLGLYDYDYDSQYTTGSSSLKLYLLISLLVLRIYVVYLLFCAISDHCHLSLSSVEYTHPQYAHNKQTSIRPKA